MKKTISISDAPTPVGSYSQAIFQDEWLIISGQICIDPYTGTMKNETITAETHQVMKNIGALLKEVQMDYQDILKCSLFIKDMEQFSIINEVYASYFKAPYPVRECVEVARLPKDANIEISVWAKK
tara:strand:+ start:116 stop:493 length:378 start_codon:yes stop_codon:yes gene_type:complete